MVELKLISITILASDILDEQCSYTNHADCPIARAIRRSTGTQVSVAGDKAKILGIYNHDFKLTPGIDRKVREMYAYLDQRKKSVDWWRTEKDVAFTPTKPQDFTVETYVPVEWIKK